MDSIYVLFKDGKPYFGRDYSKFLHPSHLRPKAYSNHAAAAEAVDNEARFSAQEMRWMSPMPYGSKEDEEYFERVRRQAAERFDIREFKAVEV